MAQYLKSRPEFVTIRLECAGPTLRTCYTVSQARKLAASLLSAAAQAEMEHIASNRPKPCWPAGRKCPRHGYDHDDDGFETYPADEGGIHR